jgi:transposase
LARRTERLEYVVHHLGLALGGRPAAGIAERLMLPVSNDTLLRVVRRRARQPTDPLAVIGIDDFAWRRNCRYGTIVCDLERRRPVVLLPDREPATAQAWLQDHRSIVTIAQDRGGGYGEAAAKALPHATQVADRWHLMENASGAFLDPVRKSMRQIRSVIGATVIDPELLTAAERIQYEGYLRREETNTTILALIKQGMSISGSFGRPGIAANWSDKLSAASRRMSSVCGKARSSHICAGSMLNGIREPATLRIFGDGAPSRRVQSRYWRRVADLPLGGRHVELLVLVRRFWCDAALCCRRIFAERFADGVLSQRARRTGRLDYIVHHLGLALGGRPGASFAERLMMPVSRRKPSVMRH